MADPLDLPNSHGAEAIYTHVPSADVLAAGRFEQEPGIATYREHGAKNWLLNLTLAGRATFGVGDDDLLVGPGDLILIAPGVMQRYAAVHPAPWRNLWVHFQPRPDWFTWWRLPELVPGFTCVRFADAGRFDGAVAAFERVFRHAMLSSRDTPHGRLLRHRHNPAATVAGHLALNGIEEILLLAVMDQELTRQRGLDPRVQQVLDTITENLSSRISLDALARAVSLSPSRLTHLFRTETGDSISNVISTLRLREAARLLEATDEPISRIAAAVGFSSPYYFSRQFRARYEMSPREYRNRSRSS